MILMNTLRTTIELDEDLLSEAQELVPNLKTKRSIIEFALQELIQKRKQKDLRDLFGKIQFEDGYRQTYKDMRQDDVMGDDV